MRSEDGIASAAFAAECVYPGKDIEQPAFTSERGWAHSSGLDCRAGEDRGDPDRDLRSRICGFESAVVACCGYGLRLAELHPLCGLRNRSPDCSAGDLVHQA